MRELIQKPVEIRVKGGNFLLNIGPDSEGNVPEPAKELLNAIVDCMKTNSEVIYTSKPAAKLSIHNGCIFQSVSNFYAPERGGS